MKKLLFLFFLCIGIFYNPIISKAQNFGIGIILGEPTGLCAKQWVSDKTAFAGAVAWSFGDEGAMHIHLDYLIHNFGVFSVEKGQLLIYYGVGGRLKLEDESRLGVRFPMGINYIFDNAPIDIFFEVVPIMDVAPETKFNMNGALGIRFFLASKATK